MFCHPILGSFKRQNVEIKKNNMYIWKWRNSSIITGTSLQSMAKKRMHVLDERVSVIVTKLKVCVDKQLEVSCLTFIR